MLFVPKLMAPIFGVCVNCVCFVLCIYVSVWLLVEEEKDGKVILRFQTSMGPELAWQ